MKDVAKRLAHFQYSQTFHQPVKLLSSVLAIYLNDQYFVKLIVCSKIHGLTRLSLSDIEIIFHREKWGPSFVKNRLQYFRKVGETYKRIQCYINVIGSSKSLVRIFFLFSYIISPLFLSEILYSLYHQI